MRYCLFQILDLKMQVQPIRVYCMCEWSFQCVTRDNFLFLSYPQRITWLLHYIFPYILHIVCQMLCCLFQEHKIIKIQAVWRGYKLRRMFLSLFHEPQPTFKVVRSFVHHLDFNTDDYRRDLQLQVKLFFFFNFSFSKQNVLCINNW